MAGRPKTMAKKLTDLEERAYQLSIDVGKLCPHAVPGMAGRLG